MLRGRRSENLTTKLKPYEMYVILSKLSRLVASLVDTIIHINHIFNFIIISCFVMHVTRNFVARLVKVDRGDC